MKKIRLSLVAMAALSITTISSANTLGEALSNGKTTGDVSITYEKRSMDKEIGTYYKDTAYSVGSFGINYKTASFNNFSANIGMRAYTTLYEADDKGAAGNGDASERFYELNGKNQDTDVEQAYIAYDLENVHVKFGRQFISTEWINKTQDAINVDANFGNSSLSLIHTQRQGRIYSRDHRPMAKINADKGASKVAFTQKFNDAVSAKAYYFTAPDLKDITGAKVNLKVADVALMAHYAQTSEDVAGTEDSNILDLKASTNFSGYSATLGYVKVDEDAAFNHVAGETIIPFEEGDHMYLKNAKTTYAMVSKAVSDVSITGLYGITSYDSGANNFSKSEFNLWLGYPMAKNFNLNVGYALINEDKDDSATYTDIDQLNVTVAYKF